jgi:outer membrane lipoprotein-sorting protein
VADGYLSGAAIQFLLGEGDIPRDFRVSAESCTGEIVDLELVPRQASTYEKLWVRVDRSSGDLLETTVVDLLGNATRVAFQEIQVNLDPAPELFRFDPPAGVRVIEVEPTGAGK